MEELHPASCILLPASCFLHAQDVLVAQMVAVQPFQPPLIDNGYAFWVSGVAKSCQCSATSLMSHNNDIRWYIIPVT